MDCVSVFGTRSYTRARARVPGILNGLRFGVWDPLVHARARARAHTHTHTHTQSAESRKSIGSDFH